MFLGKKIRELRESQGIVQRQIAFELDIDTPMLSKIERGIRTAKREQVVKLAKLLNTSEQELLTLWLTDKINTVLIKEDKAISTCALDMAKKLK